jgi:hypothetical protein
VVIGRDCWQLVGIGSNWLELVLPKSAGTGGGYLMLVVVDLLGTMVVIGWDCCGHLLRLVLIG